MSVLFTCTVPGKPVPASRPRVTRFGTYYGKTYKAYRKVLAVMIVSARGKAWGIDCPVRVEIGVCGARADSDLDNHAKAFLDAAVNVGLLARDDLRVVQQLSVAVLSGDPRMVASIFALYEEEL